MKFSEMWLREWINPCINHDQLINQLSMSGFKVEESIPISKMFHGVVIGEIITYTAHPNLENTWLVKINNGNKKLINIICQDIDNLQNQRVVVANVGALLPNGQIVTSNIVDGKKSEGILCTFSILGLKNYPTGIIKLPPDAPIGYNFYDYLKFNDNIINIDITPNRGDCLSIIGISREIATINQLTLKKLTIDIIKPTIKDTIPIVIENPIECPLFLGRILKNINTTVPTPLQIQEKLRRCGVQTISVVLDIINYVLLELGHPTQAFDYETMDHKIYIRSSQSKETLTLPNNTNLKLVPNTLIISDNNKPLAIAGIITGNQSCISLKTRNIFLQTAFFNPVTIIQNSKLYNLHTLESIRYERGVDHNTSELALNYITSLLLKICNGYAGPIIKIINNCNLPKQKIIILHRYKLQKILGFYIQDQEVTRILNTLGFQAQFHNTFWKVLTPTWRFDITIEENLISEIVRIHGYDNIPQISIKKNLLKTQRHTNSTSLSKIKTTLVSRGYQEVITYSFVNPNIQKLLHPQHNPLTLMNPISLDMSVMRLSLWTGLLKTVIYNQNRQQKHIQLFESGICFMPDKINNNQVSQEFMIAGVRSGLRYNTHWDSTASLVDFYDIKGDIEALLNMTNKSNDDITFKYCTHATLHPKKSAAIYLCEKIIGYVGLLHPIILKKLNLHTNTLVFEIAWNAISKFKLPKIFKISKFPKNYRDISLIVPVYITAGDIINTCKKNNFNQLIDIQVIDVYVGHNIPKNHKSFTIKFTVQGDTHTLREQEISQIINECLIILKKKFHIILR